MNIWRLISYEFLSSSIFQWSSPLCVKSLWHLHVLYCETCVCWGLSEQSMYVMVVFLPCPQLRPFSSFQLMIFIYLWSLWNLVILEISVLLTKLDWSQWGCWRIIWRKWERQAAQVDFLCMYTCGLCCFRYLWFWLLFVKAADVL